MATAATAGTPAPEASGEPVYALKDVGKTYASNAVEALTGVTLTLNKGSFSAVIGSSGCGKSTLLKIMAGLIPPSTGRVVLSGRPVTGPRRDIGMMFQQATLFPWRTTIENVVLPIEIRNGRQAARAAHDNARALLELVGAQGLRGRLSERAFRRHGAARRDLPDAGDRTHGACCWTSRSARSTSSPATS